MNAPPLAWSRLLALFIVASQGFLPVFLARAADPWSGSVEIKLDVDANSNGNQYSRHETQTWTLTGGAPKQPGAMALYPAKWHYTGGGSKTISFQDPVQGPTQRRYDWSVDVTRDVQVAIHVRASDQKLVVHQWTATLSVPNAISASRSATIAGGIPTPSSNFTATADQWNFSWIEADPASTDVSGSNTVSVSQLPAPMGLDGTALPLANVTWHLALGAGTPAATTPAFNGPTAKLNPGATGLTAAQSTQVPSTTNVTMTLAASGAVQGAKHVLVTASAAGAHWQNGVTQADFGPGITVTSLNVTSPTYASGQIDIAPSAAAGKRPVTFTTTTGTSVEKATSTDGLSVDAVQDPTNFTVKQTGDGQVQLSWNTVHYAYAYVITGPGTAPGGTKVQLQSPDPWQYTLTGIPAGPQEWRVTSWYDPDGSRTDPASWPKAGTTVIPYQGRYRILFNGFRVNHQTFHDIISPNGSGDDVYAAASVQVVTRNASGASNPLTLGTPIVLKTLIHGNAPDPNQVVGSSFGSPGVQAQVRAGSATATGGLTNGDVFPTGQNPASSTAAPVAGSFPFLLWDGDLSYGKNAVIIVASLWKMTTGDTCVYDYWAQNWTTGSLAGAFSDPVGTDALSPVTGPPMFPCFGTTDLVAGNTVPINAHSNCSCTPRTDRPIGVVPAPASYAPGMHYYSDIGVAVNLAAIEKALATSPTAGIIDLHFADNAGSEFGGDYDLFLRVEREPTIDASAPPNVSTTQAPSGQVSHAPSGVKATTNLPLAQPGQSTVSKLASAITAVTPNSGPQWSDALVVTFDAQNTAFAQGTTTVDLGPGVTPVAVAPYQAVDVASPTKVLATLKIAGDAAPGPRTVTITTGGRVVKLDNGFTVTPRAVSDVFQVNPNSAQAGQQGLAITIARPSPYPADYFAWQGTTLDFGPGIEVASFERVVAGDFLAHAKATLNLAASAAPGPHTVTVKRPGLPDEIFPAVFTVNPFVSVKKDLGATMKSAPTEPASLVSVVPNSVLSGRTVSLVVQGKNTHFTDGSTGFGFGAGTRLASSSVTSPTSANVDLAIDPGVGGPRTLSVITGTENLRLDSALSIINPVSLTLNPNTAVQGASVRVNFTAPLAHFVQGKTIISGLSTGSGWAVTSPTTAYIDLRIPASQPAGVFTFTLTTDNEVAEALNGFTITLAPDPWGKSCASATGIGSLSAGTSATRPGTIHAQGVRDWFAVSLPYATSLSLSVQPDYSRPGIGNSDFELVIYRDNCSTGAFASTVPDGATNDPSSVTVSNKTITVANNAFEGPETTWFLLVCVQANQWSMGQPNFVLNLTSKSSPPPAPVTTPYPFSFSDTRLALPGLDYNSDTVTIQGINVPVSISINDKGYYSLNGGSYTSAPGTVYAGDKVCLRARLDALDVSRGVTLTVGGQSATWWLTVKP